MSADALAVVTVASAAARKRARRARISFFASSPTCRSSLRDLDAAVVLLHARREVEEHELERLLLRREVGRDAARRERDGIGRDVLHTGAAGDVEVGEDDAPAD